MWNNLIAQFSLYYTKGVDFYALKLDCCIVEKEVQQSATQNFIGVVFHKYLQHAAFLSNDKELAAHF